MLISPAFNVLFEPSGSVTVKCASLSISVALAEYVDSGEITFISLPSKNILFLYSSIKVRFASLSEYSFRLFIIFAQRIEGISLSGIELPKREEAISDISFGKPPCGSQRFIPMPTITLFGVWLFSKEVSQRIPHIFLPPRKISFIHFISTSLIVFYFYKVFSTILFSENR